MENHEPFLREAIALSKSSMEGGDEPFGSVLVKHGEVILRAENSVFTGHDMTNHAEMNLVKLAAQHYDVRADITVLSKALGGGLPLAAVLMTEDVAGALKPGRHGSTLYRRIL